MNRFSRKWIHTNLTLVSEVAFILFFTWIFSASGILSAPADTIAAVGVAVTIMRMLISIQYDLNQLKE